MKKKTILVVDDSTVMRQLNAAILETGGYRVQLAEDGQGALDQLRQGEIHLVLTDWTMMPMAGGELIRQIRLLDQGMDVPILVVSTVCSEASKAEARSVGASGWVGKPVEPQALLAVVTSLMTLTQA
ncbi:two-component system, chemotaxis family, response regulator CheY [Polaromonas sp. OV174]|uniref:response regulator n=1 Tax=Polaromonas sp. OV174 TaxID=1855300 RepID=UPI0008EC6DF7|nr:response regulator [Polaromonas sp. OV174]SFC70092.1 two-component system, chemotaxis family, response regulator CheY [Polaromonas sp. OV174]